MQTRLSDARVLLGRAERAYTTRRIPPDAMKCVREDCAPAAGDLVLARVERIGHHRKLHRPDGSRKTLFVGDPIIVAYGDRYAPDQFEARVPDDLAPCELVAGGGIAARVEHSHKRIGRGATRIRPIGLVAVGPEAPPLNVASGALVRSPGVIARSVPVVGFVGTSMNSGKTTAASSLIHGLAANGKRVGYAKVTGTGAAGDACLVRDAGASVVLDFTDVGYASTYRVERAVLERVTEELVAHLLESQVDVIVLEVADGLLQRETSALVSSDTFLKLTDGVLLACRDSLSAVAGVDWLRCRSVPLVGLTGVITNSPLQMREASAATGAHLYTIEQLDDPATAVKIASGERLS